MNDPVNPMNPVDPVNPINPPNQNPVSPGPVFEETTNTSRIYQIALGVVGFLLLVALIFVTVYYIKANRTTTYINQKVDESKGIKEKEVREACEIEKTDMRENPWTNFTARSDFGAFSFTVPRNWSQYEHFDINANEPYSIYFSSDMVKYDAGTKKNHAALEVTISKKLYNAEIKAIQDEIKRNKDANKTEESVNISNFTGTKFTYKDEGLGKKVGVIVLPYRDRVLFIKTDDYDQWNEKYYDKFYKSFAITP
ncbi:MAG: hypothetical protein AAB632_01205 [Patescibacteria group bacterium]